VAGGRGRVDVVVEEVEDIDEVLELGGGAVVVVLVVDDAADFVVDVVLGGAVVVVVGCGTTGT
jgi:hypothetical protein